MGPNFLEEYSDCEHGLEAKILGLKVKFFFKPRYPSKNTN